VEGLDHLLLSGLLCAMLYALLLLFCLLQVMHYITAVQKKKIAVHCHAGLGRTGLAIACYLVASGQATAEEAVVLVRKDRPGALQTSAQVVFVSIFEQYLQHLRCVVAIPTGAA
jgi:protein tyrosine phosphatase domain-containing protein 1